MLLLATGMIRMDYTTHPPPTQNVLGTQLCREHFGIFFFKGTALPTHPPSPFPNVLICTVSYSSLPACPGDYKLRAQAGDRGHATQHPFAFSTTYPGIVAMLCYRLCHRFHRHRHFLLVSEPGGGWQCFRSLVHPEASASGPSPFQHPSFQATAGRKSRQLSPALRKARLSLYARPWKLLQSVRVNAAPSPSVRVVLRVGKCCGGGGFGALVESRLPGSGRVDSPYVRLRGPRGRSAAGSSHAGMRP